MRWAADLAEEIGNPLLFVHVIEPIVVAPQWQAYVVMPDEARLGDARARLQDLARTVARATASECVVETGRPADTIALVAEERRAALIVIGLASSQGLLGARPGAIAYRVLCLARTPVLVVPPQQA
jgi:nucleotide-binding universal stress UspA family protein